MSKALKNKVTADALLNGKMYFNIAEKLFNATLKNNYDLITDYSSKVQTKVNNDVGIRLKAQVPKLNQDRVDGLIKAAANAKDFEEVSRLLGDPIVNFSQSVVDDTIMANAEFLDKAGFKSKIKRIAVGRACKWCRNLGGVYDYPHTPEEIYHRHENCRCRVDYFPNGKRSRYKQNVHSKKYIKANSEELKKLSDEVSSKNKNRNKPLEILAITEAKKLGYNPLPTSKVVNELRKQARKWEKVLTQEEIKAINKYTYNGVDDDGQKLYFKINEYLEGRYTPKDENEEEIILRNAASIENGLMKFRLQNDIIVYRNDRYSEKINGKIEKFISTSIVPNGVLGKKANIAIIVPKESNGSYIELLADDLYKRQREFLINKSSTLKLIKYLNGLYIFKVG
ncbi:hypothetical protein H5991_06180 [Ligilactobacillus agilis]|uniref:VG15 protein n=1 Tax=Ligilactobacillus agilis TaxID=1601 RepID=UPI00195BFAB0|nr:ADP-ribosyltransferase [Ligilactobacillus agilis]MBM6773067.1 hypothetical protein [Ligilactobacillus agilis]